MRFPPPTAVCLGFISIAAKGDRLRRAGYVLMTVHCGWRRAPPDLIWAWPDMACAYNASMWSRDHWPFVTRRDSCSLSFCMIISKETATIVVQGTVWLTVWWCGSEMKICLWQCFRVHFDANIQEGVWLVQTQNTSTVNGSWSMKSNDGDIFKFMMVTFRFLIAIVVDVVPLPLLLLLFSAPTTTEFRLWEEVSHNYAGRVCGF